MTKEQSLSDKRISSIAGDELPMYEWDVIKTEDVKEAVARLKDIIKPEETSNPLILYSDVCQKIDKIFGEKLT